MTQAVVEGNIDLEKLARIPLFYQPQLSRDEKKLTFYWDKTGKLEFYKMDLEPKNIEKIPNDEFPDDLKAGYIWTRDDSKIIFAKDKGGNERYDIFSYDFASNAVTQLTNTPEHVEYIMDAHPDGEHLLFTSNRHGPVNIYEMKLDGSDVRQITAHENSVWVFFSGAKYSPSGDYIAYSVNEEGDLKNQDLYIAKRDGTEVNRIVQTKIGSQDLFVDWSKNEEFILFITDLNGNFQSATYGLSTKEVSYWGDASMEEIPVKITKDNSKLIVLENKDSVIAPIIYDVATKTRTKLNFPPGIAAGTQLIGSRYLILTLNHPKSPSSLIKFDLNDNTSEILIDTDLNGVDPTFFTDAEYIWYNSLDGTKIPAIVYRPRDFDPSKSYPGIIVPHGGPTGQYFNTFNMGGQYLADRGFIVMYPNVRGSTGYGNEFRDACIKDWGGKDLDDWVAARSWMIENARVDPSRVGMFGGSYGGYATLISITKKPDLWKAAVSAAPISHLVKMYERQPFEHFKQYFRQQMGDPVKDKELWEDRSPLNYAQNVTSKLLLMAGEMDPRTPPEEARDFADKLRDLGRSEGPDGDFQYMEWTNTGHGKAGDVDFRIDLIKNVSTYFSKNL